MALDIQSKEAIDKISDELKVQPATMISRKLDDSIQPVFEVGKAHHINFHGSKSKSTTGTITVIAAEANRDTFITNLFFNWQADAANTGTELLVTIDIEGFAVEREVISLNKVPSVAAQDTIVINFPVPIKMTRGGNIKMTHTFAAGTGLIECNVMGYTTDPQ